MKAVLILSVMVLCGFGCAQLDRFRECDEACQARPVCLGGECYDDIPAPSLSE